MAYTSDDLAVIERAIASGTRAVRFSDGRSVEYQSMQDLMSARSDIQADIAKAGTKPVVRQIRVYTDKGF